MTQDDLNLPIRSDRVQLADAIAAVRYQLIRAQLEGQRVVGGKVLTFEVGTVTLEFTGEIEKTNEVSGGIAVWVLTAEGKHERASSSGQTITVELRPHVAGEPGRGFDVNDDVESVPER